MAASSAKPEIAALNGLRGLAAITVFVSHAGNAGIIPQFLGRGAGHMGVMLFFTLSAFLLTHLYLHVPATRQNVRTFAIARFARVYSLFIAVLSTGVDRSLGGVRSCRISLLDRVPDLAGECISDRTLPRLLDNLHRVPVLPSLCSHVGRRLANRKSAWGCLVECIGRLPPGLH